MKTKVILFFIVIAAWCGVIFYFSNKTSNESNGISKRLVYNALNITIKVTNKLKITNIELGEVNYKVAVNKLNYPLRKFAHVTIYFVLAILIFIFLKSLSLKNSLAFLITIFASFLFSLTDEYHQTFINDRTGRFSDCLIDTTGAFIGTGTLYLFSKRNNKYLR